MKRILILLTVLMLLTACGAKNDAPLEKTDGTEQTAPADQTTPADQITTTDTDTPQEKVETTKTETTKVVTPLVTFLEIGAESCIPCRMMQPIMKEIREEYNGLVDVIFHDLYKDRQIGQKYGIRVMPTQVFLDSDGKEFFRHEGFYPKEEIEKMLAEKIGVNKPIKRQ